mmetsp:Transcript_43036/g.101293  ORF Transcript_43036/g.101293 Transcript_43036/m.101293 type:complete len:200 (-) Transcript_43036:305-904(-)
MSPRPLSSFPLPRALRAPPWKGSMQTPSSSAPPSLAPPRRRHCATRWLRLGPPRSSHTSQRSSSPETPMSLTAVAPFSSQTSSRPLSGLPTRPAVWCRATPTSYPETVSPGCSADSQPPSPKPWPPSAVSSPRLSSASKVATLSRAPSRTATFSLTSTLSPTPWFSQPTTRTSPPSPACRLQRLPTCLLRGLGPRVVLQ